MNTVVHVLKVFAGDSRDKSLQATVLDLNTFTMVLDLNTFTVVLDLSSNSNLKDYIVLLLS